MLSCRHHLLPPSSLRRWGRMVGSPTFCRVRIASESNRNSSISHSDTSFKIAQRISCALHRENARAILKRAPEQTGPHCSSLVSIVRVCTLTSSSHPNFVPGLAQSPVPCGFAFCVFAFCLKVSGRSWQWQVLITMFAAVFLFVFFFYFLFRSPLGYF